jgi:hypothetical protein
VLRVFQQVAKAKQYALNFLWLIRST